MTAQVARATAGLSAEIGAVVERLVGYLATSVEPEGLFAPQVFTDLTLPLWRVQAVDADGLLALRAGMHPCPGDVRVERVDAIATGFVLEFEERWEDGGQRWYSREMLRADIEGGRIVELSVYCTGDWDAERQREHARTVRLVRN